MGKKREESPSSSSSEFEFNVAISPRKSSPKFCPADELFYKGQLLPLHYSTRLSVVRSLLASASSSSSSDTSRDSTGSLNSLPSDLASLPECESSRPSSVVEEDGLARLRFYSLPIKKTRTFSFTKIFRKSREDNGPGKRVGNVFRKYLKKVKPLYARISQRKEAQVVAKSESCIGDIRKGTTWTSSFSGNLRYPRKRNFVSSCPSSIRSSPSHSGLLSRTGSAAGAPAGNSSSTDELHHAIQGAIAYCKSSMAQSKSRVSEI